MVRQAIGNWTGNILDFILKNGKKNCADLNVLTQNEISLTNDKCLKATGAQQNSSFFIHLPFIV